MKNKWAKRIGLLSMVSVALVTTTGCDLLDQKTKIEDLRVQAAQLAETNKKLQNQIAGMTITETPVSTSLRDLTGEGIPQFVLLDGKIVFARPLEIPNASTDVANSIIRVGSMYRFEPSEKWLLAIRGSEVNISHPANIRGKLRTVQIEDFNNEQILTDRVKTFFSAFPKTDISYRKIYMNDTVGGIMGTADVDVVGSDGKTKVKHRINAGLVNWGDFGLLYVFDSQLDESGLQQEIVDTFIRSGYYGDVKINLD